MKKTPAKKAAKKALVKVEDQPVGQETDEAVFERQEDQMIRRLQAERQELRHELEISNNHYSNIKRTQNELVSINSEILHLERRLEELRQLKEKRITQLEGLRTLVLAEIQ